MSTGSDFTPIGGPNLGITRDPDALLVLAAERGVDPLSLLDLPDDEADEVALLDPPHPQDVGDTVTLSREMYRFLWVGNESWRRWWSDPDLFQAAVDREISARIRQTSYDISGAIRALQVARGDTTATYSWGDLGPSHAKLEQLRSQSAWVLLCRHKGCKRQITVYEQAERKPWDCGSHARDGGQ